MKYVVPILLVLMLAYPLCMFAKRSGHHPLLGLFFFVPFLNIVMLYVIACMKWPIEYEREALIKENEALKAKTGLATEHTTKPSTSTQE
jgi:hypothetical protein